MCTQAVGNEASVPLGGLDIPNKVRNDTAGELMRTFINLSAVVEVLAAPNITMELLRGNC